MIIVAKIDILRYENIIFIRNCEFSQKMKREWLYQVEKYLHSDCGNSLIIYIDVGGGTSDSDSALLPHLQTHEVTSFNSET